MKNLNNIINLLSEDNINDITLRPIKNVEQEIFTFLSQTSQEIDFKNVINHFIHFLYLEGVYLEDELGLNKKNLSYIVFLEKYYHGIDKGGYAGAVYDFGVNEKKGIKNIIDTCCQHLIAEKKSKYIKWVYENYIDFLNWDEKLNLVEEFKNSHFYKHFFNIHHFSNDRIVNNLRDIIEILILSINQTNKNKSNYLN